MTTGRPTSFWMDLLVVSGVSHSFVTLHDQGLLPAPLAALAIVSLTLAAAFPSGAIRATIGLGVSILVLAIWIWVLLISKSPNLIVGLEMVVFYVASRWLMNRIPVMRWATAIFLVIAMLAALRLALG